MDDIEEKLEKLFNQDFNERLIDNKPDKSKENFEIALPLRHEEVKMPNNRPQTEQRKFYKGNF